MKKYRVNGWDNKIEPVEVIRETENFVILKFSDGVERRDAKRSEYTNYFDTWREAHEFIVAVLEEKIASHENDLQYFKERLAKARAMKRP